MAGKEEKAAKGKKSTSTPKQKPKALAGPSKSAHLSLEQAISSDEEDATAAKHAPVPAKKTPTKPDHVPARTNGVKRSAQEASSTEDTESEDESEGELPDAPPTKKPKVETVSTENESSDDELPDAPAVKVAKGAETSTEEEEADSSSDEEDDAAAPAIAPTAQSSTKTVPKVNDPLASIPAKPYPPPSGFVPIPESGMQSIPAFSADALASKQIWHITAPSSLPLSSLTSLTLDAIKSQQSIFTHNGTDYLLHPSATSTDESILRPSAEGYTPATHKIDKTYHLQPKITLPNLSIRQASSVTGGAAAANIAQPSVSSIKPQPKGLRMRYKPPGYGPGRPGLIGSESDSEEGKSSVSTKAALQFPQALGVSAERPVEDAEAAGKKPKKKRKEGEGGRRGSVVMVVADAASETQVKTEHTAGDGGVKDGDVTLSKEEKAKRKEEKRLRREEKEAKAKAKS